jgi:hypothetical protein
MKIFEISRTISGNNYDNLSAKALVEDGESVVTCALVLDGTLKKAMEAIYDKDHAEQRKIDEERTRRIVDGVEIPF